MNDEKVLELRAKLFSKIRLIAQEVGHISKDRVNSFQKYKFRGIDDALAAFQPLFVKHGIAVVPSVLSHDLIPKDKGYVSNLALDYRIIDTDSGYEYKTTIYGLGDDSGDKGVYKAYSGAFKYLLFQLFCVPTSEPKDPEEDSPVIKHVPSREEASLIQEWTAHLADEVKSKKALMAARKDISALSAAVQNALRKPFMDAQKRLK